MPPPGIHIRTTKDPADPQWLELRTEFIEEDAPGENARFLADMAGGPSPYTAFVATDPSGRPLGFAEVSIRHEYVNGCTRRPALFLEGIFVREQSRGRGIARALCRVAADWGRANGCSEFASDVMIDDERSLAAHAALGFAETERVVYFRMPLGDDSASVGTDRQRGQHVQ
jgi:aminoglycoside 6'-N-acetyltransferase I